MVTKEQLALADQRSKDLSLFVDWIKTVPREDLERSLIDGFWKGQLDDSELKRFFECERRTDANMFSRKIFSKQGKLYKKWREDLLEKES